MKKWFLLILAYGIVFSPVALAVDQDNVQYIKDRWAAEAKLSQSEVASSDSTTTGETDSPNPAGSFCKSMFGAQALNSRFRGSSSGAATKSQGSARLADF